MNYSQIYDNPRKYGFEERKAARVLEYVNERKLTKSEFDEVKRCCGIAERDYSNPFNSKEKILKSLKQYDEVQDIFAYVISKGNFTFDLTVKYIFETMTFDEYRDLVFTAQSNALDRIPTDELEEEEIGVTTMGSYVQPQPITQTSQRDKLKSLIKEMIEEAYMSQEEAKIIKDEIKKNFPAKAGWKISMGVDNHSTFVLKIFEAPYQLLNENGLEYRGSLTYSNQSQVDRSDNIVDQAKEDLFKMCEIVNRKNYDKSDIMTDYFDVGYYVRISIGDWKTKFKVAGTESSEDQKIIKQLESLARKSKTEDGPEFKQGMDIVKDVYINKKDLYEDIKYKIPSKFANNLRYLIKYAKDELVSKPTTKRIEYDIQEESISKKYIKTVKITNILCDYICGNDIDEDDLYDSNGNEIDLKIADDWIKSLGIKQPEFVVSDDTTFSKCDISKVFDDCYSVKIYGNINNDIQEESSEFYYKKKIGYSEFRKTILPKIKKLYTVDNDNDGLLFYDSNDNHIGSYILDDQLLVLDNSYKTGVIEEENTKIDYSKLSSLAREIESEFKSEYGTFIQVINRFYHGQDYYYVIVTTNKDKRIVSSKKDQYPTDYVETISKLMLNDDGTFYLANYIENNDSEYVGDSKKITKDIFSTDYDGIIKAFDELFDIAYN